MLTIVKQVAYFLKTNAREFIVTVMLFAGLSVVIELSLWLPLEQDKPENWNAGAINMGDLSRYFVAAFALNLVLHIVFILKLDAINSERRLTTLAHIGDTATLLLPMVLGNIVIAIVCLSGLALFIIPGIYFFIRLCLFDLVLVLQRPGVFRAMALSMQMTKGIAMQLLQALALSVLVFIALISLLSTGLSSLGLPYSLQSFANEIVAVIGTLFWLTIRYRYYLLQLQQQPVEGA